MGFDISNLPNNQDATDNVWEVLFTQRAIRYWQDRPVPRELLEQVVEAGSKAPSGSNSQPWEFIVIDSPETREALGNALKAVFDAAEPLQGIISAGENSENKTERLMLRGARNFFTRLGDAPAIIIPCLHNLTSPTTDPRSLEAGSSIYLAVQNMMLAARALGLGTLMTTAQGLIDAQLREILAIPDDAHPVAIIPVGYPDANFGPTTRRDVSDILHWNKF